METKSPHFWWIISLMSITIIALISYIITEQVCCSDKLMEYVSVCSVILSITLSIFAIQYTYTSNNEVHQSQQDISGQLQNITNPQVSTDINNLQNR